MSLSTSTLAKTASGYLETISLTLGSIALQGPHHAAVKSITSFKTNTIF